MSNRPVFPGLDTMRAVASVAVVGTHTSFFAGTYSHGLIGAMTQRLEVGVAIFFVLSGFLLSRPWWQSLSDGSPRDTAVHYLVKRGLRVLPVFWVSAAAAIALLASNRALPWSRKLETLALVDVYTHGIFPDGLTQMWSLATEVAFYLVLPLAMWMLVRAGRGWRTGRILTLLAAAAILSQVWVALAARADLAWSAWTGQALPAYISWFGAGIALAMLDVDRRRPANPSWWSRQVEHLAAAPGTCWLLAGAVFVVASTPIAGPAALVARTPSESVCRNVLYVIVAVLVLVPSIFGDPASRYARVLGHGLLRHLGHTSYSLFCCHVLILELVFRHLDLQLFHTPPVPLFMGVLILSLIVSEVLYRGVERPFLKLKNARWPGRRGTTQPTNAPSETSTRT